MSENVRPHQLENVPTNVRLLTNSLAWKGGGEARVGLFFLGGGSKSEKVRSTKIDVQCG